MRRREFMAALPPVLFFLPTDTTRLRGKMLTLTQTLTLQPGTVVENCTFYIAHDGYALHLMTSTPKLEDCNYVGWELEKWPYCQSPFMLSGNGERAITVRNCTFHRVAQSQEMT